MKDLLINEEEKSIVNYIKINQFNKKTRKRKVLDPRNFLINILYHKYGWTESDIASLVNRHHTNINHCKNDCYYLWNDPSFITNTQSVRNEFPLWVPIVPDKKISEYKRKKVIMVQLNKIEHEKLLVFKKSTNSKSINVAFKKLAFEKIKHYE
tara:strand:+ start:649 stop:1107 length:459 start_codon:yes stop_codon:yes gene_type:complete